MGRVTIRLQAHPQGPPIIQFSSFFPPTTEQIRRRVQHAAATAGTHALGLEVDYQTSDGTSVCLDTIRDAVAGGAFQDDLDLYAVPQALAGKALLP
jgi:hypothetical protein